jgi:hypothetical protein
MKQGKEGFYYLFFFSGNHVISFRFKYDHGGTNNKHAMATPAPTVIHK